ncbi:MAG: DUF3263 domain-containing protein [Acidimicrobiales bacterium]
MALSRREREALDLEGDWWRSASTKQHAIRQRLGCSPATHYAMVRRLAGTPEAFEYDPLVVSRLRRRLDRRRREQLAGKGTADPRATPRR